MAAVGYTKAFTAAIRNRIFTFLRALAIRDYEQALASLTSTVQSEGAQWTTELLRQRLEEYLASHDRFRLDPTARNIQHTYVTPSEDKRHWRVQQML
ncbi:MAG: DUF3516 domain-containing protein, partial [Haliea sp.]